MFKLLEYPSNEHFLDNNSTSDIAGRGDVKITLLVKGERTQYVITNFKHIHQLMYKIFSVFIMAKLVSKPSSTKSKSEYQKKKLIFR